MQTVELQQGTPEWHAFRAAHYTASDAPAMLGISPYKTRNELLREKNLGITPELDAATQARMAKGHEYEAQARSVAEAEIGEELYPAVGVCAAHPKLAASFDGITMDGRVVWEHKTLNNTIRAAAAKGEIPEHHRAQLEHQLLVSGADKAIFCASNGTGEHISITYTSDPAMRQRIEAGWRQFEADLAAYTPAERAAPVTAAPIESLPAVVVQVNGALTVAGNLPAFGQALRDFIARIPARPVTDQQFADADAACKALKKAEDALSAAEDHALAQISDVEQMRRTVADLKALARSTRLATEKMVKAEKDNRRAEKVMAARSEFEKHVARLQLDIKGVRLIVPAPDFGSAIKGLSSLASIDEKLTAALIAGKAEANTIASRITDNLRALDSVPAYAHLFADRQELAYKDADALELLMQKRVDAEQARIEAERERIRLEEERKAQAAAEQARQQAEAAKVAEPAPVAQTAPQSQPAQTAPSLTLGQINARLGFVVTADFLQALGFEATQQGTRKLYYPEQFQSICQAIARHVTRIAQE